jgi:hypothetical protein
MADLMAGPGLDRRVAEAVGFRANVLDSGEPRDYSHLAAYTKPVGTPVQVGAADPRMPQEVIPKFSTDLNAAFAAAERVYLFAGQIFRDLRQRQCGDWCVWDLDNDEYVAEGPTPALAICAAILKEKK